MPGLLVTAAVMSNPGIRDIYGFAQGLDYYRYINCYAESGAGVCDGMTVNRIFRSNIIEKIKDENFFVYLHYMDVHNPYHKPIAFKGRFMPYKGEPVYKNGIVTNISSKELRYSIACYDECIIYMDKVLKNLFTTLESEQLLERSLVIITSDHGDEFLEHGGLGHGTTCYNELIQSFIIFLHPRLPAKTISSTVSLVDVLPTVLDWCDVDYPSDELDGETLMPLIKQADAEFKNRIFASELGDIKAVINKNMKYIYNLRTKSAELYDLKKNPEETENVVNKRKRDTARLFKIIKEMAKKMTVSYSEKKLSDAERKNLQSLGYIR